VTSSEIIFLIQNFQKYYFESDFFLIKIDLIMEIIIEKYFANQAKKELFEKSFNQF
jgi:hypothetical protein